MSWVILITFLIDRKLGRTGSTVEGSLILARTVASCHCKTGEHHTSTFKKSILRWKRNVTLFLVLRKLQRMIIYSYGSSSNLWNSYRKLCFKKVVKHLGGSRKVKLSKQLKQLGKD